MNRSLIYEFLREETDLELRFTKIGKGSYPVLRIPFKWDQSYLLINNMRITDFQAIMLFSKELVVRFMIGGDCQINIPYKDIEYIEVREDMDIPYQSLYEGKKAYSVKRVSEL